MTDKKEAIMDILMNYLPKEGVSKTRDKLVELFTPVEREPDETRPTGILTQSVSGEECIKMLSPADIATLEWVVNSKISTTPLDKYILQLYKKVNEILRYLQPTKDSREELKK